eukprot:scaffold39614_cov74-Phaeocystis_antarctica.AAC.2
MDLLPLPPHTPGTTSGHILFCRDTYVRFHPLDTPSLPPQSPRYPHMDVLPPSSPHSLPILSAPER